MAAFGSCGGSGGGGGAPSTGPLSYANPTASYRVGVPATPNVPSGGPFDAYDVAPALPPGLALDPGTGVVFGTPSASAATADHVVTATGPQGPSSATLSIQVTPALPPEMTFLVDGFEAAVWLGDLATPVKMAFAPDGRLFFNELGTGNVRVVDAAGSLLPAPFAAVTVLTLGEVGLLGLALAPDFATSGHVFVYASVPAGGGHADRNQVLRFTAAGDVAAGPPTVVVDDLPVQTIHNAGDLRFGPDGNLYVSLGDVSDAALAQTDGSRAGRILRYTPAGGTPADNPIPGDPEWVRGLRNSFDMAFHPGTGGLFASENGPTSQDELNFVQKGKNYAWPSLPGGVPPSQVGHVIAEWTPVIAPTGIAFHDGTQFGAEYADDLFLGSYVETEVRRLQLSGAGFVDLDAESLFARWTDPGSVANKPLDLVEAPDGSLLVSTFSAIWRIRRSP